MGLDKGIIKARTAEVSTFQYQARDLSVKISDVAISFADRDAMRSPDFKLSELIAKQAGISQLENEALKDKINAQVLEQLKEVEERAYAAGHEIGMIEGSEKAFQETKTELLDHMQGMEDQLKLIEDLKSQMLVDNEAALIRLVFLVAKKLALRDLGDHREAVWELMKNVVGETQEDERVVVKLSPEDLLFLESLQEKGGRKIENLERVKLVADDSVTRGGCLIETEHGDVDATVEERVERAWATLEARIPKQVQS